MTITYRLILRPFTSVVALLVCFGLALILKYFLHPLLAALAGLFRRVHIPGLGHPLAFIGDEIAHVESWVQHELGRGVGYFEGEIVGFFEGLALLLEAIAHLFTLSPLQLWQALQHLWFYQVPDTLAKQKVTTAAHAQGGMLKWARTITAAVAAVAAYEGTLTKELHGVEGRLTRDEVALRQSGAIALPLPGTVPRVGTRTRPGTRVADAPAGTTPSSLRRRIALLEWLLGATAITGIVANALSRLGWQRQPCESNRLLQRAFCRVPVGLLEDLLAGVVDVLLIADICRIVTLMTQAARLAAPEVELLSSGVAELIRCQNVERPGALAVAWYDPPTTSSSLALA